MIDLHSHILPGIDDGARTLDDSLEIAWQSYESGVTHMLCTPHINEGVFDNSVETISLAFESLNRHLIKHEIPLSIAIGSEVRVSPSIIDLVKQNKIPFIGTFNEEKLLLLELPHSHITPGVENLVRWLKRNNIQPVIPHPERNREIISDYRKILHLESMGCIFQVTAGSFIGRFSEKSKEIADMMLHENKIAYVASDTHNVKRRPNDMSLARDYIDRVMGEELAYQLTTENPRKISELNTWVGFSV